MMEKAMHLAQPAGLLRVGEALLPAVWLESAARSGVRNAAEAVHLTIMLADCCNQFY